jgi:hypothetical protein
MDSTATLRFGSLTGAPTVLEVAEAPGSWMTSVEGEPPGGSFGIDDPRVASTDERTYEQSNASTGRRTVPGSVRGVDPRRVDAHG